jgi:choline-sulfatase
MERRPNFLVIMADQHSPHLLGCAGHPVVRTPNLDRLAAQGVRFASAYCPFPLCVPSRMAFVSGQPPEATGARSNGCQLPSDVPTFAHALGAAGYETVLCGRMHFNGPDQHHGFERRLVGDVSRAWPGSSSRNLGHIPTVTTSQVAPAVAIAGPGRAAYEGFDEAVTAAAVDYLRQRQERRNREEPHGRRPFCLVVGLVLPHNPYICARDLFEEYEALVEAPAIPPGYLETLHPAMRLWRQQRGVDTITPQQHRRARAAYYGLTTVLDRNVGRLLEALTESGAAGETAVVYTSDHGDMAGELGLWWKSSMYEGSVGVPLLWSWPGRFVQGRTVTAVTRLLDVAPTLTDLAGAPSLPHATGRSLLPWLRGAQPAAALPDWPDEAYAEMNAALGIPAMRMLRRGPWKLVHFDGYPTPQLFHLEDDPHEVRDLGQDPALAGIRDRLLADALAGWSAPQLEATLARRARDREVLAAWGRALRPPQPAHWTVDPAYNVFPDEPPGEPPDARSDTPPAPANG